MKKLFAGIDLGTSGCRLIIIDSDKKIVSSESVSYSNPDEQSPSLWWDTVCELIQRTSKKITNNLQSLSINGTSGTVLLVDDKGVPVSDFLMYNDLRAIEEAEQINRVLPKDNGGQGASGSLARVLWLLKNDLNIQNIEKEGRWIENIHIVHQADFILGRLTLNYSISDENNCLKMGYDVVNQCWPIEELNELGIEAPLLPKVYPAGTAVGQIDNKTAVLHGLPTSLVLVSGTTDSIAAFVATGASNEGDAVTSLGSTLVLKLISDKPIFSPKHGIYSHRLNNHWLVGGASNSGAKVLQHFFKQDQIDSMTKHLKPNVSTELNYYPLINMGERFPISDVGKKGVLTPRPDSDIEFFQGILEGIADIESLGYQKLTELGSVKIKSVRSVGGGSKNNAWTHIRKNNLNVNMITPEHTEAAYGSALLALQGFNKQSR